MDWEITDLEQCMAQLGLESIFVPTLDSRWWQLRYFLMFTPNLGKDFQFDGSHIFQMGW